MFAERFRSHHDALRGLARLMKKKQTGPLLDWEDVKAALKGQRVKKTGGCVYIHVPYCDKICSFCNLNRQEARSAAVQEYSDYIVREIEEAASLDYVQSEVFDVIYMGGGTPTILSGGSLRKILKALRDRLPVSKNCEISLETTLHNLPLTKVEALMEEGVNRLSVGIQSFADEGRRVLGRSGGRDYAQEKMAGLREFFPGTLCMDVIYNYPDQPSGAILEDAAILNRIGVDSVSFYSLMIHDGSRLARDLKEGKLRFVRTLEEEKFKHNSFLSYLEDKGYELLELSKIIKPGRDNYRYITNRYDNRNTLPLGTGAGGRLGDFSLYSMAPGRRMASGITPRDDHYNRLLGQLQYGNYNRDLLVDMAGPGKAALVDSALEIYREQGFLRGPEGKEELSHDGVFWGNNIAVDFLERLIGVPESRGGCNEFYEE